MILKILGVSIALVCGIVGPVHAQQKLAAFRNVVVADNALPVQKAAAEELADYIGRISGKRLTVVPPASFDPSAEGLCFFVGDTAAKSVLGIDLAPWKEEEWLLQSVAKGLVIAGDDRAGDPWSASTPAGSMLAAYTLLEDHLGVHWFWPGPFGEHVPNCPDAVIPMINLRRTPAFAIRSLGIGYSSYHTRAFNDAGRRWARRSRLAWVRSAVFGHSWYNAFDFPNGQTFKDHGEWFALVDGKRRPPQMCTTNPEVIEHMVQFVLKSKLDITNISPSDGDGFCECETCSKLDVPGVLAYDNKHLQLSDRIFTYANEVARRVREKDPNKGVGMFAYTFYNRPPVRIKTLEPNLYLSFVYQSASHRNPQSLKEWRDSVAGWKQMGAKMVVREGWGNHYYFDLPFLHYRQIISNLSEAHRSGFMAAYGEGSKNFATQAPNIWAITRMMWDPQRDTAQIMPEYYRSAYGPAAEEMEAFFETYNRALDENWSKLDRNVDTNFIAYANIIGAWRRLIPVDAVAEAEEHLKKAERLAPPGEYADRIKFHRFGQEYTAVMVALLETYRQLGLFNGSAGAVKLGQCAPEVRERLLREALLLGERREQLLLAHRDWAGPDEGLYGETNDRGIRQWHGQVKQALQIDRPSAVTKATLSIDPPFYPDKTKLLVWREVDGKEHAIETAADWGKRREHILANMQLVMGPLPDDARKVPLDVQVSEEIRLEKCSLRRVTFAVEKGDRLFAYLLIPDNLKGKKVPALLCPHPSNRALYYAIELADRGYVTVAPDYPNYGNYKVDEFQNGYVSATMKAIWNNMRAVDFLQSLPEVDPERIGVIGLSLGGHSSMYVAAFDPRIKCVVSSCGFTTFPAFLRQQGSLKPLDGERTYMPRVRTVYEMNPEKIPFDFPEIVAALAPRPFLAIAPLKDGNFDVQGVKDCIAAAKPVYELLGAAEQLAANYPDGGHGFPPADRKVAYEWLDRWLKHE